MNVLHEIVLKALPGADIAVEDSFVNSYVAGWGMAVVQNKSIVICGSRHAKFPLDEPSSIYRAAAIMSGRSLQSVEMDNICQELLVGAGASHIGDDRYYCQGKHIAAYIANGCLAVQAGDIKQTRYVELADPHYVASLQSVLSTL